VIEHGTDGVVLEHVVERPQLSLRRNITVTDGGVSVTTVASNVGRSEVTVAWGHHPAFQSPMGTAVLTGPEGLSRIDLDELAPSHFEIREAGAGVVVVRRPDGIRIELCWSPEDFPYLWIWTERNPTSWPFAGDVTLVAIEPQISSRPDGVGAASSRGETLGIAAGASVSRTVRMAVSRGPSSGRQP
jgi:galactose mutarotase-like enzyme